MPVPSREVGEVLRRCAVSAAERGHARPTLEHLLLALSESEEGGALLDACAVDRARLRAGLEDYLAAAPPTVADVVDGASTDVTPRAMDDLGRVVQGAPTDDVTRVMRRAEIHCQSAGPRVVHGENVIVSLFSERRSPAVALLEAQGMTRRDASRFIVEGARKAGPPGEGA